MVIVSLLIVTLLMTGCAGSDKAIEDGVLNLTFDGENCTYEGPTLLKAGPVTLHFNNNSEEIAGVDFTRHKGDETIQDVIDYIGEEPTTKSRPSWAIDVTYGNVPAGETLLWEGDLEPGIHNMVCIRASPHGVWFGTGLTVEE
jgi:hypothetical protein